MQHTAAARLVHQPHKSAALGPLTPRLPSSSVLLPSNPHPAYAYVHLSLLDSCCCCYQSWKKFFPLPNSTYVAWQETEGFQLCVPSPKDFPHSQWKGWGKAPSISPHFSSVVDEEERTRGWKRTQVLLLIQLWGQLSCLDEKCWSDWMISLFQHPVG